MGVIPTTALTIPLQKTSDPVASPTPSFSFLEAIIAIAKRILGAFSFFHAPDSENANPALYTNNLKNREFDKEAPSKTCLERATIADRQGASEDKNSKVKLTPSWGPQRRLVGRGKAPSKTDSSGCLCITPKVALQKELGLPDLTDIERGPNEFHVSKKRRIAIPITEEGTPSIKLEEASTNLIEIPPLEEVPQSLALTPSDELLTMSHIFQWSVIGATYFGLAPAVAGALSALLGVGSEIANYRMLPENASFWQKAMTFPILSKAVLGLNPVISKISRAYSLFSSVRTSVRKLSDAWEGLKSDPVNAAKAGTIHLFNLASNVAFSAEGAGLVRLRAKPPCPPKAKANLPCDICGLFCVALYLLGVFDRQKSGKYSGVKVDFEKTGLYYDAKYDETYNGNKGNWFENYFNPVDYQDPDCPDAPETTPDFFDNATYADANRHYKDTGLPKERAKALIEQHLVLKPEIQLEIDQFTQNNFSENDYVLGIHYRGTDKVTAYAPTGIPIEARPVSYQEMTSKVQEQINGLKPVDQARVKILAVSDEEGFVQHMKTAFPGRVVSSPSERSTNGAPLHFKSKDDPNYSPYKVGKEALIDAWLLGTLSHILIRSSSNLGKFASFLLRDGAKEVQVSKRIHEDPIRTPA